MTHIASIPSIKESIESMEKELDFLAEKMENLCDKGQVTYYLAQEINEKREKLNRFLKYIKKEN